MWSSFLELLSSLYLSCNKTLSDAERERKKNATTKIFFYHSRLYMLLFTDRHNFSPVWGIQIFWSNKILANNCLRKRIKGNEKTFCFNWHTLLILKREMLSLYSFNRFNNVTAISKFTDSTKTFLVTKHWKNLRERNSPIAANSAYRLISRLNLSH